MVKQANESSGKQAQMNAVWQRISDKADERARVEGQARSRREASESQHKLSRVRVAVIAIVVVLLFVALAFAVWFFVLRDSSSEPTVQDDISHLESIDETTDEGRAEISNTYSADYDEYFQYLSELDPAKWTQEDADKAAFLLEYTQKLGQFSQASDVIGLVIAAKNAGSPINHGALSDTHIDEINQWIWNESMGGNSDEAQF